MYLLSLSILYVNIGHLDAGMVCNIRYLTLHYNKSNTYV